MSKKFLIGTDPEFFLRDGNTKALVSAIPFIAGTKHSPIDCGRGIGLSFDNVALEFASPVSRTEREFVHNVKECFKAVYKRIPKHLGLSSVPAAFFNEDELQVDEAKQFGCDPDFNAWTLKMNKSPDRAGFETLRSCGGHVHVGHKNGYDFLLEPYGKVITVRAMDCVLGLVSVILDRHPMSNERRRLYGKAGCHRPTDYGVEYRTMSNWWLKHPLFTRLVYSLTKDSLEIVDNGNLNSVITDLSEHCITKTINIGDASGAVHMVEKCIKKHLSPLSQHLLKETVELTSVSSNIQQNWNVNVGRV